MNDDADELRRLRARVKEFDRTPPSWWFTQVRNLRIPPITKPMAAYTKPIAADRAPTKQKRRARPRPVRPNAGLEALYRKRMTVLVDEMAASVEHWLAAAYRANEPRAAGLALDEAPADALRKAVRDLAKRWLKRFEEAAPKLADWFAQSARNRSDKVLMQILRDGGFTVRFRMTKVMADVMKATVGEQVGLIRSIPSQYFTQIEGMVMRAVSVGGDLGPLANQLRKQYGVTKRRAALIARDQNSKANAVFVRVRQVEAGITKATWLHSGGGREPRPTHVANSGKVYDVAKGWFDPAIKKWIWPGTEINCRCVSIPVVKGFT